MFPLVRQGERDWSSHFNAVDTSERAMLAFIQLSSLVRGIAAFNRLHGQQLLRRRLRA